MTTTDTPRQPPRELPEASRPPGPTDRKSLRPLLMRLHFYAGLLVAPFLLVALVSGFLYAATPQLERLVYADELTTDSRGPALPLDDQIAAAREVEPDLPLSAVRPADEPGQTTQVLFDAGRAAESYREGVFVDPVTGEVTGRLTVYGTTGALPLRTWVDDLHRNLHLGALGRNYSELAASWLWVIALGGLVLWWSTRRRERGRAAFWARLRPHRKGGKRQRTLSWHGAVGTWLVLGMLMLSATGLTWSRFAGANVTELRTALDWSTPAVTTDLEAAAPASADHAGHTDHGDHSEHAGGGDPESEAEATAPSDSVGIGFQWAWETAREQGLTGYSEIVPPAGETGTYVVTEVDRAFPQHLDAASIDPNTLEVVDVVRFDDYPFMAKMARWGVDLHMGTLFGVVNQVGLMLLAGALIAMLVWGYRMWWLRRPTRGALPAAPARGAWRQAPPRATAVLLVVAVAVGWFLPVWGVSVLLFLLADQLVGAVRARRGDDGPAGTGTSGRADVSATG